MADSGSAYVAAKRKLMTLGRPPTPPVDPSAITDHDGLPIADHDGLPIQDHTAG